MSTFVMTLHDSSLRSPSVGGTGRQEAASGGAGTTPASRETRPSVYRRGLTLILVLLAALGVIASVLSIWSHQVLLNTDRFMATVEPVARDPEVISAVSQRVGEEIVIALDIQRRAADVLPERAGFLTDSLATATADFIQNRLETFFSRVQVQDALLTAIRFAHERLVAFLRGEGRALMLSDGNVTLNLFPLIDAGFRVLEGTRLFPDDASLPDVSQATPDEGRAALSNALGVQLSPSFGEVVVAESAELDRAQTIVQFFDVLVYLVPLLTIALMAGAIAISPNRRRTVIHLSIGTALAVILTYLLIELLGRSAESAVREYPAGYAATQASLEELVSNLATITVTLAAASLIVAVGAAFMGASRVGVARTGSWIAAHLTSLRLGGVLAALSFLLFVNLTWATLITIVLLLIAYEVALSVIEGRQSAGAAAGA